MPCDRHVEARLEADISEYRPARPIRTNIAAGSLRLYMRPGHPEVRNLVVGSAGRPGVVDADQGGLRKRESGARGQRQQGCKSRYHRSSVSKPPKVASSTLTRNLGPATTYLLRTGKIPGLPVFPLRLLDEGRLLLGTELRQSLHRFHDLDRQRHDHRVRRRRAKAVESLEGP